MPPKGEMKVQLLLIFTAVFPSPWDSLKEHFSDPRHIC